MGRNLRCAVFPVVLWFIRPRAIRQRNHVFRLDGFGYSGRRRRGRPTSGHLAGHSEAILPRDGYGKMSNGDQGPDVTPTIDTIVVEVKAIACPDVPTELPFKTLDPFFRDLFCQFNQGWGLGRWTSEILAGLLVAVRGTVIVVSHIALTLIKPLVFGLAQIVFGFLDQMRKELDSSFTILAGAVLNELLGTEFTVEHLATGTDVAAHLARAQEIGLLFHRQLISEFLASTGITLNPPSGTFTEPTA